MLLAEARKKAKEAGLPASAIRSASSVPELQKLIDRHTGGNGEGTKVQKRSAVKKAVAKKRGRPRKAEAEKVTKKRGRPKKSETATTTAKRRGRPPKSESNSKSTKKATTKSTTRTTRGKDTSVGRMLLDGVDYKVTDGWNPREGSAPDTILKALRKAKGDREKAFEALKGDLWKLVGRTKRDGSKRSKAEGEWYLRYRISRTAWDFAIRTGQHSKAENRATYGEGGTGVGVSGGMPVSLRPDNWGKPTFKRAGSRKSATKAKATKKSTRKAATAKKGAGGRRKAAARVTGRRKTRA